MRYRRAMVIRHNDPVAFSELLDRNLILIQDQFGAENIKVRASETVIGLNVSSFFAVITFDGDKESRNGSVEV